MPYNEIMYRGYHIKHSPKPIPVRDNDWDFWHDEYDGAMDSRDNRAGTAPSVEAAKREIDEIEDGLWESRGMLRDKYLGDLGQVPAREIERELKRASGQASIRSGQADYQYWRRRRAQLLRAAQRYRSLTSTEQRALADEARYEMEESDLSKRLDDILFS